MTSGKFQGSNTADFSSGVADLYTIASQPAEGWNQATITNTTSFRYVRYVTPANGYLNVAEIEFYGAGGTGTVAVTGVTMSPTTASVAVSGTQQLTATVAPSNATNKSVSWSSGNTGIATVNSSGLVTGIAAGSATITVTSQDGSKTATCAITVTSGGSSGKLTGTVIGTSGSYDATSTIDKAYDGNTSTYVDNLTSGAWAGLDLGSGQQITSIKYFPRSGWASRMVGGKFQGSGVADFSSAVVDLYTVPTEPPVSWNEIAITNTSSFRYVRYLTPDYGYCNVAEIEFYGTGKSSVKSAMTMADQVFTENMIVSPNPATNVINISGDVYEVRIYSLHGNLIMSVYRSNSLDVSSLSKGLYIVRINDVHGNQRSVKLEIR